MKKKLGLILVIVFLLSSFSSIAFASDDANYVENIDMSKVNKLIYKANEKIDKKIEKAIEDAENAQKKHDNNPEKSESDIQKIIDTLIKETNKIAFKAFQEAGKQGVVVECVLIEVHIGGQNVWIDPLRVVGR